MVTDEVLLSNDAVINGDVCPGRLRLSRNMVTPARVTLQSPCVSKHILKKMFHRSGMLTHTHSSIHLLIIQRAAVAEGIVFPSCLSIHLSVCCLTMHFS